MKNRLVASLSVSAVVLFLPLISQAAGFDTNLKYGMRGQAVIELQEFLISKGDLGGTATGNFYSLTLTAVKKFQTENNLPSTGYFGPMSRTVATQLLSADLKDSDQDEITQTGTITPAASSSPTFGAADNAVINQLNQKIDNLTNQLQTQNTPAPVVEVQKSIKFNSGYGECLDNIHGRFCDISVSYLENGKTIRGAFITVSADDQGIFTFDNTRASIVTGMTSQNGDGRGNISAYFVYWPKAKGNRVVTVTVNGVTSSVITQGQTEACNGLVFGECNQ